MNKVRGFTLLEVLIALAILAIAMAAVARASAQMTDSSHELKRRLLANWVAENRLAERTAQPVWPDVGFKSGETEQAGLPLRWEETVAATPNSAMRRIEIRVTDRSNEAHALARLVGYLAKGKD